MSRPESKQNQPVIENRRARFDYHISETLEVGIELWGPEVKSVRDGKVSLAEGYVTASEQPLEMTLHGVTIAEYPPAAGRYQHAPSRARRLLAHKREIRRLARQVSQQGFTIVPLRMYFKHGFAKLLIGVARGKAAQDKRQSIAERESQRDIARAMSRRA